MRTLKQSGVRPIFFLLVLTADHITGATGLTPTVTISKDGATFGAPAGTVTEVANGWYKLTPTSADTGTLGALLLHASGTGTDPVDHIYQVVAYDPENATTLGLTNLDAAITTRMATYTQPTGFLAASFPGSVGSSTYAGGAVASVTAGVTVTTNNDKSGYALSSAGVQAIWDALTSALTTVGSIGKRLADNVDALISSRSTYAGGDTSGTTTLLGRLTSGRATNLDNLDAAVSSRSTFAGGAVASVTGAVGSVAAGGIATSSFAVGAIDATVLASSAEQAIADKVMATPVDGTITHKQMMQILGAALAGKASGAGTTTITFRDVNDTRNCIIATTDAIGDRSVVTFALV